MFLMYNNASVYILHIMIGYHVISCRLNVELPFSDSGIDHHTEESFCYTHRCRVRSLCTNSNIHAYYLSTLTQCENYYSV